MIEFFQTPSLRDLIIAQGKQIMAVSAQVQSVLDKATQAVTIEQAVVLGLQAQATQIQTLNATIAQLQATIAAGGSLGPDDIAALATAGQDLDTVNTALQSAIPANTTPAAPPAAPAVHT